MREGKEAKAEDRSRGREGKKTANSEKNTRRPRWRITSTLQKVHACKRGINQEATVGNAADVHKKKQELSFRKTYVGGKGSFTPSVKKSTRKRHESAKKRRTAYTWKPQGFYPNRKRGSATYMQIKGPSVSGKNTKVKSKLNKDSGKWTGTIKEKSRD